MSRRLRRRLVSTWKRARVYLPATLLILLALAAWQLYVSIAGVSDVILPTPVRVASTLTSQWSTLEPQVIVTLREALTGFALGVSIGVGLAILITSSRILRLALYPLLIATQAIPVLAIAPLLITWFGYGDTSKVLVSALLTFFPVVVNTATGLDSLDPGVVALMRSFPARRIQIFWRGTLPNALPQIFSGLKIAAVLSVIGAVVGEWVGADAGLGYLIVRANASLSTDLVFAAIVLLALMGILFFGAVAVLESIALPWRRQVKHS